MFIYEPYSIHLPVTKYYKVFNKHARQLQDGRLSCATGIQNPLLVKGPPCGLKRPGARHTFYQGSLLER